MNSDENTRIKTIAGNKKGFGNPYNDSSMDHAIINKLKSKKYLTQMEARRAKIIYQQLCAKNTPKELIRVKDLIGEAKIAGNRNKTGRKQLVKNAVKNRKQLVKNNSSVKSTNDWNEFRSSNKGKGMSKSQMSTAYKSYSPSSSSSSSSNSGGGGRTMHTGSRGGSYYINSNGNKSYSKK